MGSLRPTEGLNAPHSPIKKEGALPYSMASELQAKMPDESCT